MDGTGREWNQIAVAYISKFSSSSCKAFYKPPIMTLRLKHQLPVSGPTRQCNLVLTHLSFLFHCSLSITFALGDHFVNNTIFTQGFVSGTFGGELS